jgi:hypothetical protein
VYKILPALLLFISTAVKAQQIDSIYVNLYTDSLKKGTYNYINIDGRLSNGRYLPLDSNDIALTASVGKFYGNTLFIDKNISEDKVTIKAVLKKKPAVYREFVIYVKQKPDDENLKTVDELMNAAPPAKKKRRRN